MAGCGGQEVEGGDTSCQGCPVLEASFGWPKTNPQPWASMVERANFASFDRFRNRRNKPFYGAT